MLKSKPVNSLNIESQGELKENPDSSSNYDASHNRRIPSGSRSKSINSFKIPIKAYPGGIANLKKVSHMPNTDRGLANAEESATKLDSPRGVQKSAVAVSTNWEKISQKAESFSPQKMYGNKSQVNKKQFLKPVDTYKAQSKGHEPFVPVKMQGNQPDTAAQAYYPIKAMNNYTLKPITINKDIASKHKISNGYELPPPFRSRKGQFVMQNANGNNSFAKKNENAEPSRGGPEFNVGHKALTDRGEHRNTHNNHHANEESPQKLTHSDVKLPKLDKTSNINKHKSDGNLGTSINYFNLKPPMNNLDLGHRRLTTESATERPSRSKVRSFDKNDLSKSRVLKGVVDDSRNTLNQPIISLRKLSPEPTQTTFLKSRESVKREHSPLPSRNLSISNIKNSQTISSIREIQDKVVVNTWAVKTQAGYLPGKGVKTNQDASITHMNFAGQKDKCFFAVCDGHGANGHIVSNFIRQKLLKNVESAYKSLRDESPFTIKEMLTKAFLKTNRDLSNAAIDINFSGSTTVSLLILNSRIWCANIGDSRAIIAKCINSDWTAHPLSRDHKPDEPSEKERIIASGGRVDSFKDAYGDPLGPSRVWLKDENLPGLAMARSFGDGIAALAGVIAEPEIMQFDMEKEDKFIVVASDGVWEFLSNKQVMDMIVPFYMRNDLEAACDKVVREATATWKEDGEIIDDITCVIISLKSTASK